MIEEIDEFAPESMFSNEQGIQCDRPPDDSPTAS